MSFIILHLRSQSIFRYDAKKNRSLLKLNSLQITLYLEEKRQKQFCYPLGVNFCDCVCDLRALRFYRNFVRHKVSAFKAPCKYPMQFKISLFSNRYSHFYQVRFIKLTIFLFKSKMPQIIIADM